MLALFASWTLLDLIEAAGLGMGRYVLSEEFFVLVAAAGAGGFVLWMVQRLRNAPYVPRVVTIPRSREDAIPVHELAARLNLPRTGTPHSAGLMVSETRALPVRRPRTMA